MKKLQQNMLVTVTVVFMAFVFGFFVGNSISHSDIQVSNHATAAVVQAAEQSQPASLPPRQETAVQSTTVSGVTGSPVDIPPMTEAEGSSKLININTATLAQLDSLPGIGEVLAQRIIDYRQTHGPFTSIAQLTNVDGIGEQKLKAIIDLITTGQEE